MSAKKFAACTKICDLRRAVISQQPLIRFRSNFARCSKIPCSVISARIFYFEVKLPSKLFFFWNFHNFSWKIGSIIKKKSYNFPKNQFNAYILVQITEQGILEHLAKFERNRISGCWEILHSASCIFWYMRQFFCWC